MISKELNWTDVRSKAFESVWDGQSALTYVISILMRASLSLWSRPNPNRGEGPKGKPGVGDDMFLTEMGDLAGIQNKNC